MYLQLILLDVEVGAVGVLCWVGQSLRLQPWAVRVSLLGWGEGQELLVRMVELLEDQARSQDFQKGSYFYLIWLRLIGHYQWRSEEQAWPGTCPAKVSCSSRSCHAISRKAHRCPANTNDLATPLATIQGHVHKRVWEKTEKDRKTHKLAKHSGSYI